MGPERTRNFVQIVNAKISEFTSNLHETLHNIMDELRENIRSMLNGARVTKEMRQKLWVEAARTATMYENMHITDQKQMSSYKAFYGRDLKYL